MSINFSLLFYLKKPKNYQSGPMPVYLRVTVAGKRTELVTGRSCEPDRWSSVSGRALGTKEAVKSLNSYLDSLQARMFEAHRQLVAANKPVTAESIKHRFMGKEETGRMLMEIFQEHNKRIASLVGDEFSPATLERYTTSLKHTQEFMKWKYGTDDIDVQKVDHAFITDYEFYLRSVRKCSNNTAVKYIKNFGKIIRICLANGWVKRNPFLQYKAKVRTVERAFLSEEELQRIAEKEFGSERLSQVRDIFLFSCFTGLAYVDVQQLLHTDISKGIDGEQWIFKSRQKTDIPSRIPLLPAALKIINRYKEHPQCMCEGRVLPVPSNQKLNAYLKEIGDLCRIKKQLTFHTARHTFATTVTLLNGVPMESVSKMLGHTNLRTTQQYAKILDIKVSEDMKLLRRKFN
jgi:site-specific recombinase XerD